MGAFRRLRQSGLSIKLIAASALLTASVVCAAFLALSFEIRRETKRLFGEELSRSQQTLLVLQSHSMQQLLLTASLITQSPNLRAAMETYRVESAAGSPRHELLATIQNETGKIVAGLGKDLLVVTDDQGSVLASSGRQGGGPSIGDDISSVSAVSRALSPSAGVPGSNFAVARFRGTDFQVGCIPIVMRDFTIGTLILGDRLDSTYVQGLRKATGAEVVVTAGNEILTSTLPAEWTGAFRASDLGRPDPSDAAPGTMRLGGEAFVLAPLQLGPDNAGTPVVLYLLRSLPQAMAQVNRTLYFDFVLYGSLAVLLAGVAAGAFSSVLSRTNAHLRREIAERERAEQALHASEEQLRQSQKLEAIGTLAGGVAHDFNNLLTVILGHTELLLAETDPSNPRHTDLEMVRQASERAAALTGQLLAFSRKQVLQPRVLDLNNVVAGVETMLRRLIGEHIDLQAAKRTPTAFVKADPTQIEQVILNLAINARDAMPHGGKLRIEVGSMEMTEYDVKDLAPMPPGSWVLLSLSDTGVGMDAATQSRLFEPFFTTKGLGKGTGLGLSSLYGIVKQSGGYIWVSSELGRGTTFNIYLPGVGTADEPPRPTAERHPSPTGAETILLVEDEDLVRALALKTLRTSGYAVLEAGNGVEALEIAKGHPGPIHLLLTDVVMPRMGGRELADRLSPLRPEMRVLYVSGYTDDALAHHGVLEPGVLLLQKPFTASTLARKVHATLNVPAKTDYVSAS